MGSWTQGGDALRRRERPWTSRELQSPVCPSTAPVNC